MRLRWTELAAYLKEHIIVNILTVLAINHFVLPLSFCSEGGLLACCDPLNRNLMWMPWGLSPNLWLLGHTASYAFAALAYAKDDPSRHVSLVIGQIVWFGFERLTFSTTLEWERLMFYSAKGHPCPDRAYFSTWQPIPQDIPYNLMGHVIGWLAYRAQQRRRSRARGKVRVP